MATLYGVHFHPPGLVFSLKGFSSILYEDKKSRSISKSKRFLLFFKAKRGEIGVNLQLFYRHFFHVTKIFNSTFCIPYIENTR